MYMTREQLDREKEMEKVMSGDYEDYSEGSDKE